MFDYNINVRYYNFKNVSNSYRININSCRFSTLKRTSPQDSPKRTITRGYVIVVAILVQCAFQRCPNGNISLFLMG